jgi:mannitol/fructose-specific phosphotransferase system IIA component (Ntr-type)
MSIFGIQIPESQIAIIPVGDDKTAALNRLIDATCTSPSITDPEAFSNAVHHRESTMTTGIGGGIAIPHVRMAAVAQPLLGVGIAPKGLDFAAVDNQPVTIMVLFALPDGAVKEYLQLLAQVTLALRNVDLFERLSNCATTAEAYALINA